MRRLLGAITLALASVPVPALAQDTLTLDQAVADALARNRSLGIARTASTEAGFAVQEAQSGLFPRITVGESWQRGNQPGYVFSSLLSARRFAASNFAIETLNHPDPVGFFRTSVGVEQMVFDAGRTRSTASAAALRREIADLDVARAEADVVLSVIQTYGRVLTSEADSRATGAAIEAAREDLSRAERRRDAGMVTEADVLSLRVHVAALEQRRIESEADAAIAGADLNHLVGAPLDRRFQVIDPASTPIQTPDTSTLVAEAMTRRPSLKASDASVRLADSLRRSARAALVPQVSAMAGVELSGTNLNDRASSWLVGGELRWTFSTGGAELARLKSAAEAASRARIEREDARSRVELEVLSARQRIEAARAREAVGAASVAQARESQRIIRDRFEAGIAGADEVLRASTALVEAQARVTAAHVDALVSRARLDHAVGRDRKGTP